VGVAVLEGDLFAEEILSLFESRSAILSFAGAQGQFEISEID